METIIIRPALRQFAADHWPALLALCALPAAPLCFRQSELWPLLLLPFGILALCLLWQLLVLRLRTYRIGMETLAVESGVLNRRLDYIELYRVVDFQEERSLCQRLLGLKTVVIHSGDRTSPRLVITGVESSADIIATVRERVECNKKRRGIHEITNRY